MKKKRIRKSKWIDFRRRYLTLDRYMSGKFITIFMWTWCLSFIVFIGLWLLSYNFHEWTLGRAFLQLTNPSDADITNTSEWIWVVCINIFGLFVLNGIILTLFVNWVSNRKERHNNGQARYPFIHRRMFAVIIGAHKIVAGLVKELLDDENIDYVIIQTLRPAEDVRKEIYSTLEDPREARFVVIYSGDRTSPHELADLHTDCAREIYIIGEPEGIDGSSHDALNLQCWEVINSLASKNHTHTDKGLIPCHIMFEYQSTFSAFLFTDPKVEASQIFRMIPFSTNEIWAQRVLMCDSHDASLDYIPLDGYNGIDYDSTKRVHLIVIGMSSMGTALAIEAAQCAHYPNFSNSKVGNPRTLITFIDPNSRREMQFFMGRFRELFRLARSRFVKVSDDESENKKLYESIPASSAPLDYNYLGERMVDIDFEFIEAEVAHPSIQEYIKDACADSNSLTTIAVCLPVSAEAMSCALYFEPEVYETVQEILVQQPETGALVDAVRNGTTGSNTSKFRKLRPFGMADKCDYISRSRSILPKLVAYVYSLKEGETLENKYNKAGSFGVFMADVEKNWGSIKPNGKSTIAQRRSNKYSANSFSTKLRSAGIDTNSDIHLTEETVKRLAETEHYRWNMEQLLLGFGMPDKSFAPHLPITDKSLRTELKSQKIHPDLISYEKLSDSSKDNDLRIVRSIPIAISLVRKSEEI